MTVPPRHEPNGSRTGLAESIAESEASLERHLGGPQWASEWSPGLNRKAFNNAMLRAWLDPNDRAIAHDLELVACTSAVAHVAALTPGTEPFQAPGPNGRIIEAKRNAGRPKQLEPPVQWRSGVLAAVITRNARALELLTAIRVEDLLRLSGAHRPSWFEVEARALVALFRGDPRAAELLRTAAETEDSASVHPLSKPWVLDVVVPEMELGQRALENEPGRFDAALETALEGTYRYFSDESRVQFDGLLALGPLAIACFAYDRGLRTAIESEYVPRWLIEGQWRA